jgi:hypothetical protein
MEQRIVAMLRAGHTIASVARELRISRWAVYRLRLAHNTPVKLGRPRKPKEQKA